MAVTTDHDAPVAPLGPSLWGQAKRWLGGFGERLPLPVAQACWGLRARRWPQPPHERDQRRREQALFEALGKPQQVLSGPFRGMTYLTPGVANTLVPVGAWLPKLLGTYEAELAEYVERCCRQGFDCFIDIGSAEGYYAVGLARRNPAARIICYEIVPLTRHLLRLLAERNDVGSRLEVHGFCTPGRLEAALQQGGRCLVLCDCEGAEDDLLLPREAPSLGRATIVVELHDNVRPGITERIRERFTATHRIERVDSRPRVPGDLPAGVSLPAHEAVLAMLEPRPGPMHWFVMEPHAGRS